MSILVQRIAGNSSSHDHVFLIDAAANSSVNTLRVAISDKTGIDQVFQQLFFNNAELDENRSLSENNLFP